MVKLKNPLLSLGARNTIYKAITFVRRRGQNIAEEKPEPFDAHTTFQLSWRHMYQKAIALWHALSAAEKEEWESLARPKHMTGFAWFISQALKPNPGLYLPLQGGTMQGDIEMNKNRILELPLPVDSQEPLTLAYYTANIAPYLYAESARAYHNANQNIPNVITTTLAFNRETWDYDAIHDNVVNNSYLTCKTAGVYIISANITFAFHAVGDRQLGIILNGVTIIARCFYRATSGFDYGASITTLYTMAVGDFVEAVVWQNSGGGLNVLAGAEFSPEFMMVRVG